MLVHAEELFGPVAVVYRAATEDDASTSSSTWAWRYHAECRECDAEVFFPSEVDQEHPRRRAANAQAAKLICADCPVVRQCLQHALAVPERFGVWGGLTPQERQRIAP